MGALRLTGCTALATATLGSCAPASPEGAKDMVANAAEWVVRTDEHPNGFPHVVMGCSWTKCYRPPHTPTCDYVNYNHPSTWRSYEIGFRCCAEAGRENR
jgi:formylglycine-generating enzyme required for sulfatase activity